MALGIIGKKIGMTQMFSPDGEVIPVTVVQAGPCTVVQKKTLEKDGYSAVAARLWRKESAEVHQSFAGPYEESRR